MQHVRRHWLGTGSPSSRPGAVGCRRLPADRRCTPVASGAEGRGRAGAAAALPGDPLLPAGGASRLSAADLRAPGAVVSGFQAAAPAAAHRDSHARRLAVPAPGAPRASAGTAPHLGWMAAFSVAMSLSGRQGGEGGRLLDTLLDALRLALLFLLVQQLMNTPARTRLAIHWYLGLTVRGLPGDLRAGQRDLGAAGSRRPGGAGPRRQLRRSERPGRVSGRARPGGARARSARPRPRAAVDGVVFGICKWGSYQG